MAKNTKVVKGKSIEDRIWDSANKLRGNLTASEYQNVVLGLVFLKYVSDCFEKRYDELVAEGDGFEDDHDEYTAFNEFWVPEEARWQKIVQKAHTLEIGKVIDDAIDAIGNANPKLKKVMPRNYAREEIDKIRLGEVVEIFNNMDTRAQGEDMDIFGRVYEYCLQNFAAETQSSGGEFYTPACIVRTIVEVLRPFKGRVYDPACGSGGMFVQSAKFIREHSRNMRNVTIYGQEFNANTWKMAHMNLAIRGLEANLGTYADTFANDQHKDLRADFIMANPPFNLKEWGAPKLTDDKRWAYGMPPANNANFAWMQHMIHHLAPAGRIGLVLANGSLSSQTGGEGEIRKNIIDADLVECIVALPSQLFYNTGIPVCLWFLAKQKPQAGKTLFIDARQMGQMVTRRLRELSETDILKIAQLVDDFRHGQTPEQEGFCHVATTEDIAAQDYVLTPGRYVGIADDDIDTEPFSDKMERLTAELSDLFAQSRQQEEEIRNQLKSIGFELKE